MTTPNSSSSNHQNREKDDSVNFLLSNINEDQETKKSLFSSFTKNDLDSSFFQKNGSLLYFLLGFIVMILTMTFFILLGVYGSSTVSLIIWLWTWLAVCCASFWCVFKKPKAVQLCVGVTVALILGILAMASFSLVKDIKGRNLYDDVNVNVVPEFVPFDGSIFYFKEGEVESKYLTGAPIKRDKTCQGTQCSVVYFCVAPIIKLPFNISSTPVSYWVGCEVGRENQPCSSELFMNSECYNAWGEGFRSGFSFGHELLEEFKAAINISVMDFGLQPSPNYIVVEWVPDPLEQARIFNALGWFSVGFSPLVFCIYGTIFALVCTKRFERRKDYQEIK